MRESWKSECLHQCDGDKGPCEGNECVELGIEPGRRNDVGRWHRLRGERKSVGSNGNGDKRGSGAISCALGGTMERREENPQIATERNSEPAKRLPPLNEKDRLPNWGSRTLDMTLPFQQPHGVKLDLTYSKTGIMRCHPI